ncbi:sugar ABC transporter permease [Alkalispirochaeta sphaeroplastigenens]|uniref:Sugar ABC transporter permease n=1 Tax=Alkalispirochaeta sphaeroplastigenens TaxID=1187066 RepID=A0A2S4JMT2_9SPIO|nr:carbohydrate ABC transporter permease [Alkalispirochaeta sphaeroplastigenens]POR00828.1 sugar ABC transporter permease [Alkalispirochaeta sphaeroplastigenens]
MSSTSLTQQKDLVAWRIFSYIFMATFTFLTVAPLIWLFYSSLKPHPEIVRNIFALPRGIHTANYTVAWERGRLGLLIANSVFYAVTATTITVILALSAGYGLAKFQYRISAVIYIFFIMGLLVTAHSVLVPLFVMATRVGIADTRLGVLLPYVGFGLPFMIYLAASYIRGIPGAVEESARIDGASYLQIFWHVIRPISAPVVATMTIFAFLANWNEFVFVFVLTSRQALRSLPVGVNAFAGGMSRDYGLLFAALVIATIPMILFYIFFHEHLKKGFAAGAVKE